LIRNSKFFLNKCLYEELEFQPKADQPLAEILN